MTRTECGLDDSDKSSESELNALLFFSAGPNDLSVEQEETDSGDGSDDAKNDKVKWAQLNKRWVNPIYLYVDAYYEGDRHLCDQGGV